MCPRSMLQGAVLFGSAPALPAVALMIDVLIAHDMRIRPRPCAQARLCQGQ